MRVKIVTALFVMRMFGISSLNLVSITLSVKIV